MSSKNIHKKISHGPEDTLLIGKELGAKCRGGEMFLLSSDLGGGKTSLTKGIAKGLESSDVVTSPTFTVSNVYRCRNDIEIHHFDFYRLNEGGMVEYELAEIINDPKVVIVIEWGDVVDNTLPITKALVEINRLSSSENDREIVVTIPDELNYIEMSA